MNEELSSHDSREAYRSYMTDSVAAFAPGRIEFLGNHLDYNGGTVLGAAINAGIHGLAKPTGDDSFRLFSESFEKAVITGSINHLEKQTGEKSWGNYCLGVLKALQARELAPNHGFSLVLTTDLPMAAGLSSSAAVELATSLCLLQLAGKDISKNEWVTICREAENQWVGLPCGILDQGTSAFGEIDRVVRIDCAHENYSTIALPPDTAFWIFDTGIKHDLVDSLYGTRNQECMDALAEMRKIDDNLEHLAHGSLETAMNAGLPENLLKRVKHVIGEQERVKQFELGLKNATPLQELGKLLHESHLSSSKLFENSVPELDYLVELLNSDDEVWGARLTGGGFGGAVLAWSTHLFSQERASSIAQKYSDKFEVEPKFHSFNPSCGAHPKRPSRQGIRIRE